jgi:subtilase family serine protease
MIEMKQHSVRDWTRAIVLSAAILATAIAGSAQSFPQANRITQELSSGALVGLPGSVPRLTQKAADLGRVSPAMPFNTLSLHFGLSAEQQIELDALTQAQQDPKSPQYHQWLTQEEYGARFGLSDGDLSKIKEWLQSQGFTVRGVSTSRNTVFFSGKAGQVESAFHTQLHRYLLNGEEHFANATELQVPAGMRGLLLAVRGLNDFRPKPHLNRQKLTPKFSLDSSTFFLAPTDWATIYNVNPIYAAGFTGANIHIGVVGQTFVPNSGEQDDIDHFRIAAGLSTPAKLTYVCLSSPSPSCTQTAPPGADVDADWVESDLDIEWAGAIGKNATVDFIFPAFDDPNRNVFDALIHAVQTYKVPSTNQRLPVISMSYGSCEVFAADFLDFFDSLGQQAASQGQTLIVSSGDDGPANCDFGTSPAELGQSVDVPSDSPYYTSVGGTTLSGDADNPSQFWDANGNAKGYIPETVWNDTTAESLAASGGGVSVHFAKPSWQPIPLNYSGPSGRFVPDISFAASANHDGYLICSSALNSTEFGNMCANGFLSSGGKSGQAVFSAGGTSAGAPSFAGMLALLVQKYGREGSINPSLYAIAADPAFPSVFHDIGVGNTSTALCAPGEPCLNNVVPCVAGTTGCVGGSGATPGTMGFPATTGYDLATGLGSVDGGQLYAALAPNFFLGSASPSAVTVTAGTPSEPISLSVSAIGTFRSNVNFSCTGLPAHAVCVFNPSSLNTASSFGPVSTILTITTAERSAVTIPGIPPPGPLRAPLYLVLALACLLFAVLAFANGPQRKRMGYGLALLLIGGCLLQSSCGGGSSGPTGTPAGVSVVTIHATSGSVQHTTTVTLTVQ